MTKEQYYLHETDADLEPGDVVTPAADRDHVSRHRDVPGYDPGKVYISTADTELLGTHGRYAYAVVPLGPVGPDPEVELLKRHYRDAAERGEPWQDDFGAEAGEPWHEDHLGAALNARTTTAARVLHRIQP